MRRTRRGELGLSLAEVLVAMTVLVIAGTCALFLYDAARRSFKKGENATEQQQAVRIGFDMLATDVRLANYNANPAGEPDDVDEGIEAAYDTAIVIRADYDTEDEIALAGAGRRSVAVGNDEIVAYVLAKPDDLSTGTLVFEADVKDSPRDGLVETVAIQNVAMVQDDPPYNLYRVTLDRDPGAWGSGGFVHKTLVLENVRSLRFRYSGLGGSIAAVGGADTPAALRARAAIQHVDIELEGLTRDPDRTWQDPLDPNPVTRSYRKFVLRGTITPRNLGMKGLVDPEWDKLPPGKPAGPGGGDVLVVAGHCLGLYVLWAPNPPADGVVAYKVNWTTPGQPTGHRITASSGFYLGGLLQSVPYTVTVQAQDAAGNPGVPSDPVTVPTQNINAPDTPNGVVGSTDRSDGIRVTWNPVTRNDRSAPVADPASPMIRDLEGYQVWRGEDDHLPRASDPTVIKLADERMIGPAPSPIYVDSDVAPCRDYYYQIVAADYCDSTNDSGIHTLGRRVVGAPPAAPADPSAAFTASDTVRLTWEPVTRDAGGLPLLVDAYQVDRCIGPSGGGPCSDFAPQSTVQNATSLLDIVTLGPGQAAYYRVQATTDCPTNNRSAWSASVTPSCTFSGEVKIVHPDRAIVSSPVHVDVQVLGGTDTYTKAILGFRNEANGATQTVEVAGPGPWAYDWTPSTMGKFLIKAVVAKDPGATCTSFATVRATVRP